MSAGKQRRDTEGSTYGFVREPSMNVLKQSSPPSSITINFYGLKSPIVSNLQRSSAAAQGHWCTSPLARGHWCRSPLVQVSSGAGLLVKIVSGAACQWCRPFSSGRDDQNSHQRHDEADRAEYVDTQKNFTQRRALKQRDGFSL